MEFQYYCRAASMAGVLLQSEKARAEIEVKNVLLLS